MANTRNANTFYIDTQYAASTDELVLPNVKVWAIIYTTSNASNNLVLQDSSGLNKISLKNVSAGDTTVLDLTNNPILFPTGIRPSTVSNCVATLVIEESRG